MIHQSTSLKYKPPYFRHQPYFFFFFFTLGTGPRRSLSLKLSDPNVNEPTSTDSVHPPEAAEKDFFIDNLLVRIHYIIEMMKWTGLAPWEF